MKPLSTIDRDRANTLANHQQLAQCNNRDYGDLQLLVTRSRVQRTLVNIIVKILFKNRLAIKVPMVLRDVHTYL